MSVAFTEQGVLLKGQPDFDIKQTFDCGQCFRFAPVEDGYEGVAFGKFLRLTQSEKGITLHNVSEDDYRNIWEDFFDISTDYGAIQKQIMTDEVISHAISCGSGIRVLRQELWEALVSFIVSQNNNIPRIKKIIEALCQNYGEPIEGGGKVKYAFPKAEALARADASEFKALGAGYRDEYISSTSRAVCEGSLDLNKLKELPTKEARDELLSLKGIGGKVADCVLLFGMHRTEVCPHDVWVKRIFSERYNIENITEKKGYALASGKWGSYAGIAQQYLFYAEREKMQ